MLLWYNLIVSIWNSSGASPRESEHFYANFFFQNSHSTVRRYCPSAATPRVAAHTVPLPFCAMHARYAKSKRLISKNTNKIQMQQWMKNQNDNEFSKHFSNALLVYQNAHWHAYYLREINEIHVCARRLRMCVLTILSTIECVCIYIHYNACTGDLNAFHSIERAASTHTWFSSIKHIRMFHLCRDIDNTCRRGENWQKKKWGTQIRFIAYSDCSRKQRAYCIQQHRLLLFSVSVAMLMTD